jgi:hypothetical protein
MYQRDLALERLDDQIAFYERESEISRRRHKWLKGIQLVAAGAIAVAARVEAPRAVDSALAALIVVIGGVQQSEQYEQKWSSYRWTCEALRREKYLLLARAGPYDDSSDASGLLAKRIEGLIAVEHARWISQRREPTSGAAPESTPTRVGLPRITTTDID